MVGNITNARQVQGQTVCSIEETYNVKIFIPFRHDKSNETITINGKLSDIKLAMAHIDSMIKTVGLTHQSNMLKVELSIQPHGGSRLIITVPRHLHCMIMGQRVMQAMRFPLSHINCRATT